MAAFDIVFAITPAGTYYEAVLPDSTTAEEQAACDRVLAAGGLPAAAWRDRLMTSQGTWWAAPCLVGRYAATTWGLEAMQRLVAYEAWHETACQFLA